jgi:hypothetical protein
MGNGMAFILAAFFFLWFLGGMLRRVLRSAEGEDRFSFLALMRVLTFITLELAGAAAEVVARQA